MQLKAKISRFLFVRVCVYAYVSLMCWIENVATVIKISVLKIEICNARGTRRKPHKVQVE